MKYLKIVSAIMIMGALLGATSGAALAAKRNMKIIVDNAEVYLEPDITSAVIAHLKINTIVDLASSRQFRKKWNYIYFSSGSSGKMKAGYVLESQVDRLFHVTKVLSFDMNNIVQKDASRAEMLAQDAAFWRHVFVSLRFF